VHLLFERGPAHELEALLDLATQLLLLLPELLEGALQLLRMHLVHRVAKLLETLAHLWRKELVVELAQLREALLERRILQPGRLEGALQRLRSLPHPRDAIDHLLLILDDLADLLALCESGPRVVAVLATGGPADVRSARCRPPARRAARRPRR